MSYIAKGGKVINASSTKRRSNSASAGFSTPAEALQWHIEQGRHALFLVIEPDMAVEMLARNADEDYSNRPRTNSVVMRYARAMAEGRWAITGEPIIFSEDGRLLNGQHRLDACIRTGQPFETVVVFGIHREAFKFMDRGKTRTASNIFAIEGIPNASLMAATTVWFYRITELGGWAPNQTTRLENEQVLDLYYENEEMQFSAWVSHKINTEGEKLVSPSLMVALHYIFSQKDSAVADEFMTKVITGIGISKNTDPEHAIRKWLLKDNSQRGGRTDDIYRAAYLVMAWNARREGKTIKLFRWRTEQNPNAPFPRIK